ncbi:phosphoribosylaminoimidazolesuccinocarboxamide synthase [Aquiluna sp. KACHI24]|uniref:phosphoribosylaminoimidazolesuccinocarboxamide synthase n=1 Tax=Aquiluna sp. KACHI24 TaxID=2968831 RepID=UPI0022094D77|nr:phosphoribosylaminoimidazolesuccinocarboxamide synthase [Aquiluna sp. KACHI24]BDQ00923.1 phosphoribosylaminoimidazole-succinocarboxamide synthase [Aquiluna sp. KACHI24]
MELQGFRHIYSGKVRELYEPTDPNFSHLVLIVASDRVSAFDHVLEPEIPGKGENLTAMTNFWFDRLDVPNHRSGELEVPEAVAGRAMIAKRLEMYPVECVVRGYLSGSGWKEYQQFGTVCGIELPQGLGFGDKLPHPIFTPAFKAEQGEHDENITFEQTIELVGRKIAEELRDLSIGIFIKASQLAAKAGLILADTKFEFGNDPRTNLMTLGDEVLTPDSSRYWDRELWDQGVRDQSFDKQIVRNWLAQNWDQTGAPPTLPEEVVTLTAQKYSELRNKLITI